MKKGILKLHLIEAHLTRNPNGIFGERMNPLVVMKVNLQEWRSAVCISGGRNPRWEFQFMEIPVFDVMHEVYIEVRDRDPLISEMVG